MAVGCYLFFNFMSLTTIVLHMQVIFFKTREDQRHAECLGASPEKHCYNADNTCNSIHIGTKLILMITRSHVRDIGRSASVAV